MIGRKMRIHITCSPEKLRPNCRNMNTKSYASERNTAILFFYRRHAANDWPVLSSGDSVRLKLDHKNVREKKGQ